MNHNLQPGLQHGGDAGSYTSMEEFVDLDNFLDNYLVQLQQGDGSNNPANAANNPALFNYANSRNALATFPRGAGTSQQLQQQQQQQTPSYFTSPQQPMTMLQSFPAATVTISGYQNGLPPSNIAQVAPPQQPLTFGGLPLNAANIAAATAAGARGRQAAAKPRARQPRKSEPSTIMDSDDGLSSGDSASSGDDDSKSRKKKAAATDDPNMSLAEKRHLALQEKNRRAQRRFRERQKAKIQELHKQIEDLTGRVSTLQGENAALQSRTSILEKVLEMRNEQIQLMQETKEEAAETATISPVTGDMTAPLVLTGMSGQAVSLTADVVKRLSSDEMMQIYQKYVSELSNKLAEVDSEGAEALKKVEVLVNEVMMILGRFTVMKPLEIRKFVVTSRQYVPSESDSLELWRSVMNSIELTQDQKQEIVHLKKALIQKMESLMDERRQLNHQIQTQFPSTTFHTRNAIMYIKSHEAVTKLKENLRNEHNLVLEFSGALFKKVLSPLQVAHLMVQAYPAIPDSLAMSSAVASDLGVDLTSDANVTTVVVPGAAGDAKQSLLSQLFPGTGGMPGGPRPMQPMGGMSLQQVNSAGSSLHSNSRSASGSDVVGGSGH